MNDTIMSIYRSVNPCASTGETCTPIRLNNSPPTSAPINPTMMLVVALTARPRTRMLAANPAINPIINHVTI